MRERLILFAKRPLEGLAKTRLAPALGPATALELYRAMLLDALASLAALARCGREVEVAFDAPWRPVAPFDAACRGLRVTSQAPGDLGNRLVSAFAGAARDGIRAAVVIGADSPTLAASTVDDAFEALAGGADLVVAPADDGGYVLVGVTGPDPAPFVGMPWGSAAVLAATRERAERAGLEIAEVDGGHDVDDLDDVRRLLDETLDPGVRARCPETARWCDRWRRAGPAAWTPRRGP